MASNEFEERILHRILECTDPASDRFQNSLLVSDTFTTWPEGSAGQIDEMLVSAKLIDFFEGSTIAQISSVNEERILAKIEQHHR